MKAFGIKQIRRLFALAITTKLLLLNLFIFFVFGVVGAIVLFSYRNIEGLLTATIVRDVNENINNAGLLKDLSAVFADARFVASTFHKNEQFLKAKGQYLIETTKAIEQKSTHGPLRESLNDFAQQLDLLLEQCVQVNGILRQAEKIEQELPARLSALEKTVSDKKVKQVVANEDPVFLEQLGVIISGYRETLLQINIHFQKASIEPLEPKQQNPATVLLSQIDDLALRFQTLTASEPEIAVYGPILVKAVKKYRNTTIQLFEARKELDQRVTNLEKSEARVLSAMKEIDKRIASSTLNMRQKISDVMQSARTDIMWVSIGALFILGTFTIFFIIRNIRKPMRAISEGIESIRSGNLDTCIELNRQDDWCGIEKALNRMAADLKTTYTELKDNNRELEATKNELQENIKELVSQSEARKKLEDQLHQSQKMEAMGTLAGGVAHDFNNILTAIIGYGHILRIKMGKDSPLSENIDHILTASERASQLTKSLLMFSRKQHVDLKTVDVNDIVRNISKLLLRVIGEDVEFKTVLADGHLTVIADSGQIEQVLMNLATNARDAMPDGGLLTIKTECVDINSDDTGAIVPPGTYVVISVSDTGTGMDKERRQRIFEPFFTTKELGKGTGLGLSIVYGIIKRHNGAINVYSELGKGTAFKIYLKLVQEGAKSSEVAPEPQYIGGFETVLVAEDDNEVRGFMKSILKEYGYNVIEAVDGEDAVEQFKENKDNIQILILDVIMPKKNGKETYELINNVKADVPVLFSSGYSIDIIHSKGILEEGADFISKPIVPHILLAKLREILSRQHAAAKHH